MCACVCALISAIFLVSGYFKVLIYTCGPKIEIVKAVFWCETTAVAFCARKSANAPHAVSAHLSLSLFVLISFPPDVCVCVCVALAGVYHEKETTAPAATAGAPCAVPGTDANCSFPKTPAAACAQRLGPRSPTATGSSRSPPCDARPPWPPWPPWPL